MLRLNKLFQQRSKLYLGTAIAGMLAVAAGCSSDNANTPRPSDGWSIGVYKTASTYQNYCASPRSGIHPYTNEPYPDKAGSTALENHFLRSWVNESYLWFDEVPDLNPKAYTNTLVYFGLLKTEELTANNTEKDRFHFTEDEVSGDQFTYTGERGGYGISWKFTGDRELYVTFIEPNSPAATAGITRGMRVTGVIGISLSELTNEQVNAVNTAIFSPELNKNYAFQFTTPTGEPLAVELKAENVGVSAVLKSRIINTASGDVGYLAFNTFNTFTAELQLKTAFDFFAENSIDDLVVDLRYNGGGYLYISAQLGYLVAGDSITDDEVFTVLRYNSKKTGQNAVYPFIHQTQNTGTAQQNLTSVNLNRVYVLTTGNTCSASESFINGMRGVGVEVIQIGSTTCGKPHGFNAQTNCGTRYFSIDFESVNGQGFGEYTDGFEPVESGGDPFTNKINGCPATDDLAFELGDINEEMLKTALSHRANGSCPPAETNMQKNKRSLKIDGEFIAPPSDKILRL